MTQDKDWPDIAGRMDGKTHILPVRVYFEDTDFSGVVYHASYLRFCERGRSDFLRLAGIHHNQLFDGDKALAFAVRHMEIDFLSGARIDDVLEVRTNIMTMTVARLKLEQNVFCQSVLVAKLVVTVVLLDEKAKPKRFPNALLTNLGDYMS